MQWYLNVIKSYAVFQGRARRKEYWMFYLFNMIIVFLLSIIDLTLGMPYVLSGLYSLAVLVPGLAVTARRLHDTGKSGWWMLIALVPFVGPIILLVFLALDSEESENKYGPNPKY